MLGILRKRTKCSCWESSAHWSWPLTRAHEKYHGQIVTAVTCLKHPWSVRLYDEKNMRFATVEEEMAFLQRIESALPPSGQINPHADFTGLMTAGV